MRVVEYSPDARQQINELRDYIAADKSIAVAVGYIGRIYDLCDGLADFPHRGRARDDLRPGLRVLGFDRTTEIVFAVSDERVEILAVYYGGQDWENRFKRQRGSQ
jgi:plasmid stabilization system protein ParE